MKPEQPGSTCWNSPAVTMVAELVMEAVAMGKRGWIWLYAHGNPPGFAHGLEMRYENK